MQIRRVYSQRECARVPPSDQVPNYYAAEPGSIYDGASGTEPWNF